MRIALVLALGGALAVPAPAEAQRSPWGGPDSPGGLFGGDPLDATTDDDRQLSHDQAWSWLRRNFDRADRDQSGTLSATEVPRRPGAQAAFRAADADRNGHVTLDELRPELDRWFRARDANGDGVLSRNELPASRPPRRTGQPRS